jgi:hypothetical protein
LAMARVNGAREDVVELFAFLHDSQRFHDGTDCEHGARAADYALKLNRELRLDRPGLELLTYAVRYHSDGLLEATSPSRRVGMRIGSISVASARRPGWRSCAPRRRGIRCSAISRIGGVCAPNPSLHCLSVQLRDWSTILRSHLVIIGRIGMATTFPRELSTSI